MYNDTSQTPLTLQAIADAAKKRINVIGKEFENGFEFLMNYPRSVTIFGSTNTRPDESYYKKAENLAERIVKELHYSIVTGGGPGIMEAANKGAFEAGGNSLGLTIELPKGQLTNKYVTDSIGFYYFFSRKVCLAFCAEAYVFFPGGFGTLDEFSEVLTLIQTGKIRKIPIILVGEKYWRPLISFFENELLSNKMIEPEDMTLFIITDNDDEIIDIIKNSPVEIGKDFNRVITQDLKNSVSKEEKVTERPLSKFFKW